MTHWYSNTSNFLRFLHILDKEEARTFRRIFRLTVRRPLTLDTLI